MAEAQLSRRGQHSLQVLQQMKDRGIGFLDNVSAIKMHSAENNLCDDLLMERFSKPDMQKLGPESFHYFDYKGIHRFRDAIANFLTRKFKAQEKVNPENLIVSTGACTLFDLIAHSIAEAGDYFMVLAPCYYGTPPDLDSRAEVKSWIVQLPMQPDFRDISINLLESELESAKKQGVNMKGIVIVNPHNPTGRIYTPQTLKDLLSFANRHNLHVIMDEIYALSVHQDNAEFKSVLSLSHIPRPEMTHLIWGFSKDLGLAGLRCGVLHTWNKRLIQSLEYILYMCAVPVIMQDKLTILLNDSEWLDTIFLAQSKRRLKESYQFCVEQLQKLNVQICPAEAGVFVWVNFAKFLKENTTEAVLELGKEFEKEGVKLAPGTGFYCQELGWFRLTFAKPREELEKGLGIITSVLEARNSRD